MNSEQDNQQINEAVERLNRLADAMRNLTVEDIEDYCNAFLEREEAAKREQSSDEPRGGETP
ncbi:hypothetical protein SIID45300_02423 [Candidatus Magnetaquicoccaceae bacterium FCR-1]|uniref:Uncharacterized protein n=1 Tax=Candidatus Magnetaquiglobus chichijimensis TaxID=3141448 RepID=A0ABQ0CB09_9PROT